MPVTYGSTRIAFDLRLFKSSPVKDISIFEKGGIMFFSIFLYVSYVSFSSKAGEKTFRDFRFAKLLNRANFIESVSLQENQRALFILKRQEILWAGVCM